MSSKDPALFVGSCCGFADLKVLKDIYLYQYYPPSIACLVEYSLPEMRDPE